MDQHITIPRQPAREKHEDFTLLRKEGIELIQKLGSALWTDYNVHDPGITLLELLCYAQTDIGFRLGFSMQDLLTDEPGKTTDYARQCLFTAREILTNEPWTSNDYRKLLIDQPGVRNAWMHCRPCGCGITLYAHCKESVLQYAQTEHPIKLNGFWDALVELDDDRVAGDLNSGKVFDKLQFESGGKISTATIEWRFPPWHRALERFQPQQALDNLLSAEYVITHIDEITISGNPDQQVDIPADALYKALRNPLWTSMKIHFSPAAGGTADHIVLNNVPVRVWYRSDEDRKEITIDLLRTMLTDISAIGVFTRYLLQLKTAKKTLRRVQQTLQSHRNLAEDYCIITTVPVEDIAICMDVELRADADIEAVLGKAYWFIEQYFNPDIPFYTLRQLLAMSWPVEDIFNGPPLQHGFILDQDLDKGELRSSLFTSDIINILMDPVHFPDIVSVRNMTLVRHDIHGKRVESQPWELKVTSGHQPRLYVHASKVLAFKNELPFLPDTDELKDTLQLYRFTNAQNKVLQDELDLSVPTGQYVDKQSFWPVQYSLPDTYGIGLNGLPSIANTRRRAQAHQLKAYLLVFEHVLKVYFQQLHHLKDLFAADTSIQQTYFTAILTSEDILDIANHLDSGSQLRPGMDPDVLQKITEDPNTYVNRRNKFLDHLLARFAESFADYALILYNELGSTKKTMEQLIPDKIHFIKSLAQMTARRGSAFDYTMGCAIGNMSGLQRRISTLLGLTMSRDFFEYYDENDEDNVKHEMRWRLRDDDGNILLSASTRYKGVGIEESLRMAKVEVAQVTRYIRDPNRYTIHKEKKWTVNLTDPTGEIIATRKQPFQTKTLATEARDNIIAFANMHLTGDEVLIIEHLLLRPRFAPSTEIPEGDALLSVCIGPECDLCGDEDPYSFRITVVLSGESGLSEKGIGFRRFAERTIRLETPAHLGVKICWVDDKQLRVLRRLWCDWLDALNDPTISPPVLHNKHHRLLCLFAKLKSVYPPASLHDCVDGDDNNVVFLGQTVI